MLDRPRLAPCTRNAVGSSSVSTITLLIAFNASGGSCSPRRRYITTPTAQVAALPSAQASPSPITPVFLKVSYMVVTGAACRAGWQAAQYPPIRATCVPLPVHYRRYALATFESA